MAVDKSKLIDGEGLDAFGKIVKTYVDEHGGSITVRELLNLVEGSQYINVDLNEAQTKAVVSLDQTNLDTTPTENSSKLITSGGAYTALQGKLDSNRTAVSNVGGLVKPLSTPTATELVGISTGMEQERVKIGDGLSYDTTTKTLTAKGTNVMANPQIEPSMPLLQRIRIDEQAYAIPSGGTGGTKLYRHDITILTTDDNGASFSLYSLSGISAASIENVYSLMGGNPQGQITEDIKLFTGGSVLINGEYFPIYCISANKTFIESLYISKSYQNAQLRVTDNIAELIDTVTPL